MLRCLKQDRCLKGAQTCCHCCFKLRCIVDELNLCPARPIKRCVVKTKPHPDCCFTVCALAAVVYITCLSFYLCGDNIDLISHEWIKKDFKSIFAGVSVACASLNFNYQVVWPIRVPRFFKLGLQLTFYYPESSDNLCLTVQNTKISSLLS